MLSEAANNFIKTFAAAHWDAQKTRTLYSIRYVP